ncbi:MAG TPA: hypothetical protein VLI06_12105 [Solimonas sp.]|nr:hypothetical protein [Solimonas sp.]
MKERILEAARVLAQVDQQPSRLRGQQLVAAGACTEQEFIDCFPDLPSFQRELLAHLFGGARLAVIRATTAMPSGLEQLLLAFHTYLDYNREHPALQELAHQVQFDPAGFDLLMRMEIGTALVAQADLEAAGARHAATRGRMLTSLVVAAVRAEYKAGRELPEMRELLFDYCALGCAPPPKSSFGD